MDQVTFSVPEHSREVRPWRQSVRGGTREDRMLREITVWLPPLIAEWAPVVPDSQQAGVQQAIQTLARLDATHGATLAPLAALLLRAESVASSKIEQVEASMDDYARAVHGSRASSSATMMVASTRAIDSMIRSVDDGGDVTLGALLEAHVVLMEEDPREREYAGRVRDLQNWIGGSDHSPRHALYVPPPSETVAGYLDDLLRFVNRDDLDPFVQAAVAHAQFESIHPFTDGNGRIGRALVNTILRRRGVIARTVVPLASAMVARKDLYFRALGDYRSGDASLLFSLFVLGSAVAGGEAVATAHRLHDLPGEWAAAVPFRGGSVGRRIIETFMSTPVFTVEELAARVGGAASGVYTAVKRLEGGGVVRSLTPHRRREQVWAVSDLVDELDDLNSRIARETMNLLARVPQPRPSTKPM